MLDGEPQTGAADQGDDNLLCVPKKAVRPAPTNNRH
jgi:hypothetical protein